ncbi:DUF2911 domain-containing protein [Fodinibius sediminis]|uniref:DUF2911 domain-containing protein n=1 Tax=Fodinibius sediminis TaxID=1214077 RepID=A0A521BG50_9BACT|nr:DUF2911 domain-containing protein [Fodinibius sediminis]SMO45690.1 Protein of unknown function [Fodinibius sediminis]
MLTRQIPLLFLLLLILVAGSCSQDKPEETETLRRKSPIAIAKVMHHPTDTYIKIIYGQPYKRNRDIFGQLVPYDNIWRTGANEATELTTTHDILLAGEKLKAGTYALFTIPREDEPWTIILNDELGLWGDFDYQQAHDVLRVDATAIQKESVAEAFTIQFSDVVDDTTQIVMQWDKTEVTIPIRFLEQESES